MPKIELETIINIDDIKIVFDLIRNIDFHKISAKKSNEEAIAGKTTGLVELNESSTWRAKHLGFTPELTFKITEFDAPFFFVDEMVKGTFKSFRHEHYLHEKSNKIIMKDILNINLLWVSWVKLQIFYF